MLPHTFASREGQGIDTTRIEMAARNGAEEVYSKSMTVPAVSHKREPS